MIYECTINWFIDSVQWDHERPRGMLSDQVASDVNYNWSQTGSTVGVMIS